MRLPVDLQATTAPDVRVGYFVITYGFTDMPADVLEIFGWIVDVFAGWRYLLSRSYRQRTHRRWKIEGRRKAFTDIVFGGLGMLLILLLLWPLIRAAR